VLLTQIGAADGGVLQQFGADFKHVGGVGEGFPRVLLDEEEGDSFLWSFSLLGACFSWEINFHSGDLKKGSSKGSFRLSLLFFPLSHLVRS